MLDIPVPRKIHVSKRRVGGGKDAQATERKRVKKNESGRRETAMMANALGIIGKHLEMVKPIKREILIGLVDRGEGFVSLCG